MKKIFTLFAAVVCGLSVNAKTIYLNTGGSDLWGKDNPAFFIHAWVGDAWEDLQMTHVSGDIFSANIKDEDTQLKFVRMPSGSTELDWDSKWSETDNLDIPSDKNLFTITGWSNGEWSVYSDGGQPGGDDQPGEGGEPGEGGHSDDNYDYYLMGNTDGTGAGDITTPTDNELFECGTLTYSFPGNPKDGNCGYFFVMRCDKGSKVGTGYMAEKDQTGVTHATLLSQATHQGLNGKMAIAGPKVTFYLYYGSGDDELILSTEELEGKTLVGGCTDDEPGQQEAVENTEVTVKARKAIMDGRLVIIRGEQMFDATGRAL